MDNETVKWIVDRISKTLLAGAFLLFVYHMAMHEQTKEILTDWEVMAAILAVITGSAGLALKKFTGGKDQ